MILQIEMVGGISSTAEGEVPVSRLGHRKTVVGEYVPVYVVRRRTQWAQHVWPMNHPQLRPTCTIHIVDGTGAAALHHRYPARQVQVVVLYLRNALVHVIFHVFCCLTLPSWDKFEL